MKDKKMQEWREKLEKSNFANMLKVIIGKEKGLYSREWVKKSKNGIETLARFRLGNETKAAIYWVSEEEKRCRMCKGEEEYIEHVLEKCEKTGEKGKSWIEQMNEEKR